ncbi:MAG: hypothetical protein ACTSR3_05910 [Candidatus Helarchaeota archaeon]
MNNGLDITENQFLKLSAKERDLIMFRNVVHIRKQLKDYRFHKKIQYAWLSILSCLLGIRKYLPI